MLNTPETQIDEQEIIELIGKRDFHKLRRLFAQLAAPDIAELLEGLDEELTVAALRLLTRDKKIEVFSYLPHEKQTALLELLPDDFITLILNGMEPDDRTHLLESLPPEISGKYILKLDPEERKMTWYLLSYPEDSVGRIMTPEFLKLRAGITVAQAIEHVRWKAPSYSEDLINQIFVVDDDDKLVGMVRLGTLFVEESTKRIEEVAQTNIAALSPYDDEATAVDHFRKYDETYIPVVDESGHMVGVVTADDVFDVAEEEATEDIQQFGGSASLEDSYFSTPFFVFIRKRVGWLAALFIGELATSHALHAYEGTIAQYAFLVMFMPLIVASGGNSGSQTASLIIRGLAIREIETSDWFKVLQRELSSGLALGMVLGIFGFVTSIIWGHPYGVGAIVSLSLVAVVLFGTLTGGMLPLGLKKIGLDPAVSSSPLIASLCDCIGVLVFFNIAMWVLHHYQII